MMQGMHRAHLMPVMRRAAPGSTSTLREKRYSRLDYAGALQWYLKAAEKGHSGAECSIGWIYEQGGNGVGRDYQKAMDWYRRAAAHGSRAAQLRLRTDRAAR